VKFTGLTLTFMLGETQLAGNVGQVSLSWFHPAGVYRDADLYMLGREK
jgi:hypothetical protein